MKNYVKIIILIPLIIIAVQPFSFSQIINEKKHTNTPYVSIIQSSDYEYIYIGSENNPETNNYDVTLTKKDLNGETKWKKSIDWMFNCLVKDAAILEDKTVIIAGEARQNTNELYPFVMKIDPAGDTLWTKYYDADFEVEKVIATSDGGYLLAYYSNGSGLMKLDAEGDSIWSTIIGKGRPYGIAETAEAVYLLVDDEGNNIVLSSVGSGGEVLWKRIFGGEWKDEPVDVINASNEDDYLFAGSSYSPSTGDDFFIGLLDCFGYVNWTLKFGGKGTDICYDLMETSSGDFIAVGASNSFSSDGSYDLYAVKFDTYGKTIWEKTFPIEEQGDYLAQNIFETSSGSFILNGANIADSKPKEESYYLEFIYPTVFELSFEADNQILSSPPYTVQFTNNTENSEYFDFVWEFGDGESLASNDKTVIHEYMENGVYDVRLIANEYDFGSVDSLVNEDFITIQGISTSVQKAVTIQEQLLDIFPNPFTSSTIISFSNPDNDLYTLKILDQNGKLIKTLNNIRDSYVELDRGQLSSGIYFVELQGKTTSRAKLLIE